MATIATPMTVSSFDDLHRAFEEARREFNRRPWFRGQRSGAWTLLPKVHRIARDRGYSRQYETTIAHKFKARAPIRYQNCPEANDDFGWLSLMRHYGLPTRLLDWTESILIAAYFAVAGKKEEAEPAIWALDPYQLNLLNDRGEGSPFSPEHDHVRALAKDVFKGQCNSAATFAVVPPEKDLRMLVQHAMFTIDGSMEPLEERRDADKFLLHFPISESFRSSLFGMLNAFNIHKPALFPDLDTLARGIEEFEGAPAKPAGTA